MPALRGGGDAHSSDGEFGPEDAEASSGDAEVSSGDARTERALSVLPANLEDHNGIRAVYDYIPPGRQEPSMLSSNSSGGFEFDATKVKPKKDVSKNKPEGERSDTKKSSLAEEESTGVSAREMSDAPGGTPVADWVRAQSQVQAGPPVDSYDEDARHSSGAWEKSPRLVPVAGTYSFVQQPQQQPDRPRTEAPSASSETLPVPSFEQPDALVQPQVQSEELTFRRSDVLNFFFQGALHGGRPSGIDLRFGGLRGGGNVCSVGCLSRARRRNRPPVPPRLRWADLQAAVAGDDDDLEVLPESFELQPIPAVAPRTDSIFSQVTTIRPETTIYIHVSTIIDTTYAPVPLPSAVGRRGVWTEIWAGDRGPAPQGH